LVSPGTGHLSASRFSSPSKVYDLTDGFHLPILNSALRAAGAGLFHAGVEVLLEGWRARGDAGDSRGGFALTILGRFQSISLGVQS